MVRLVSAAQKKILMSSDEGTELLKKLQAVADDISKLKSTNQYRKGKPEKLKEMKDLVASRTVALEAIAAKLASHRAGALSSVSNALGEIVRLASGARTDVAIAQSTEDAASMALSHLYSNPQAPPPPKIQNRHNTRKLIQDFYFKIIFETVSRY